MLLLPALHVRGLAFLLRGKRLRQFPFTGAAAVFAAPGCRGSPFHGLPFREQPTAI